VKSSSEGGGNGKAGGKGNMLGEPGEEWGNVVRGVLRMTKKSGKTVLWEMF
jgi:hypothetical protein